MASKRMFSIRLINSARFLKMPISSQALYFHLGMRADDDGIVEAYTVLNNVGCSEDDLKVLASKGFIQVLNEDLVSYITDGNENNYIRADRKIDSIYQNLLISVNPDVKLIEKTERADVKKKNIVDGQWTDNGQTMDGIDKDREEKNSLEKINLEKNSLEESNTSIAERLTCNYQQILDLFNEKCPSLPKALTLTDKRKKAIKARLRKYSIDDFIKVFEAAEQSPFLRGEKSTGEHANWKATIDFLLREDKFVAALEGQYMDFGPANNQNKVAAQLDNEYEDIRRWAESGDQDG